eukprot:TRINITY_DN9937_c0_g1_i2.p1 TRINITY_DN9937_c0_g1~~TRINITY_DN9937_c0_g1_i2.p1  ORF type:complete len:195 (+),score=40.09 TRINITY_DN9937_c0_g1_i2:64-585(+)
MDEAACAPLGFLEVERWMRRANVPMPASWSRACRLKWVRDLCVAMNASDPDGVRRELSQSGASPSSLDPLDPRPLLTRGRGSARPEFHNFTREDGLAAADTMRALIEGGVAVRPYDVYSFDGALSCAHLLPFFRVCAANGTDFDVINLLPVCARPLAASVPVPALVLCPSLNT